MSFLEKEKSGSDLFDVLLNDDCQRTNQPEQHNSSKNLALNNSDSDLCEKDWKTYFSKNEFSYQKIPSTPLKQELSTKQEDQAEVNLSFISMKIYNQQEKKNIAFFSLQNSYGTVKKKYNVSQEELQEWKDKFNVNEKYVNTLVDTKLLEAFSEEVIPRSILQKEAMKVFLSLNMELTEFWYEGFVERNKDLFEESLIRIKTKEETISEDTQVKSEWKLLEGDNSSLIQQQKIESMSDEQKRALAYESFQMLEKQFCKKHSFSIKIVHRLRKEYFGTKHSINEKLQQQMIVWWKQKMKLGQIVTIQILDRRISQLQGYQFIQKDKQWRHRFLQQNKKIIDYYNLKLLKNFDVVFAICQNRTKWEKIKINYSFAQKKQNFKRYLIDIKKISQEEKQVKIEEILNLSDAEYEKLFNGTINFEIAEKVSEVCCNFSDDQKYKIAEDSFQKSLKDTQKKYLIDYKKILSWRDKMFGTKEEIQRSHDQKIVQWWLGQDNRTAKLSVIMEKAKELLVARNIKITNVWWQKFIQRNTQEIEKNHLRIEQ